MWETHLCRYSLSRLAHRTQVPLRESMANRTGVTLESDLMRYAEYTPKSTVRSEADVDKRVVSVLKF